jgi:hypothetical protein
MKTTLALLALLAILSYSATVSSRVHREKIVQQTFSIDDQSVQDLGYDTLYWVGGSAVVDMPSNGSYTPTVVGTVASISINNQIDSYPSTATLTLPSGATVKVQWNGANNITITDVTIVQ